MAQRIFQSFRRLPSQLTSVRKKQDTVEVVGSHYKINVCSNVGFPAKPSSLAYDQSLDIFALATRDGIFFGKPGVVYYGSHKGALEIIKVLFFTGMGKLLTLSVDDIIYVWEIVSPNGNQPGLQNIGQLSGVSDALESKHLEVDPIGDITSHITALIVSSSNSSILVGTDQGNVAPIRRNTHVKQGVDQDENTMWIMPSKDKIITPHRALQSISPEKRTRLRLDAVVVLLERPSYPSQLLIGYSSGICLLYDLQGERVLALLPCQYELEAATWCGGSGLPVRGAVANPTATPPHLGTRVLTAYGNGSLGVWQIPLFATGPGLATELGTQTLQMMESPSMPYGPFPCKLISKVFWLPSHEGGITIFTGGMPRSIYGDRNTVSILRGSNLDQAAAANLAAALRADSEGDADCERSTAGQEFYDGGANADILLPSGLVPGAPVHVFDSDAPEHVCLDLPSLVVDVCPLGPAGGPVTGLLILCEEELIAIDLLTPGWPLLELPYLNCLHASSLTTYGLFTQVNPAFLEGLEAIGGGADAVGPVPRATGLSTRTWPIQGGELGRRNEVSEPVVPSDDLLITGHENGTLQFWRLAAGGCARKIFCLFTGSLFEGDFGPDAVGDTHRACEEESEPWPPFRRVGLFDPFMDDVRAAIKVIHLVDSTLVVGGAAGQVSVWQLAPTKPTMATLDVPVAPEVPGFRWKGYAPLTLRRNQLDQPQRLAGASLFPMAVALCQPPSPVTCLSACELSDFSAMDKSLQPSPQPSPTIGVLVGMGTAHGFALMHISASEGGFASHLLLHHSTIPSNAEALEEAAVGEGWARRRTRELKNSLRDSFRRLKRMKSGRSTMTAAPIGPVAVTAGSSTSAQQTTSGSTVSPPANRLNHPPRVGLRKSVSRSASAANQGIQIRGDPLQEALSRVHSDNETLTSPPLPTGCEREICDRPAATANTALVRCMAFGPPLHHRLRPPAAGITASTSATIETSQLLGSFFAATAGGATFVFALYTDNVRRPSHLALRQATQMQLQHRAPIVALRLIDTKTHCPLLTSSVYLPQFSSPLVPSHHHPLPPHLMVISEEQVRLFSLPSISLRQKARITAKDGFRIKTGNIMAFGQLSNERNMGIYGIEFNCVFTNNGGQAVVLSVPYLRRRDTIALLGGADVLEINSIVFATAASTRPKVTAAPSLGVYQTAPGQLAIFDMVLAGQRSSALGTAYRTVGLTKVAKHSTPSPSPRLQQRLVKPSTSTDTANVITGSVPISENTRPSVNGF
ncbi:Lethal(2) giant larvae protein [Echinococcus granulosus]|uniref:Lethal(2) giant larvae protein n=1 Tax=Echinococcus granulosus TaxID=6210 RepID=W6V053_ECHGR|nr:Lethal(2) giant larvae protein [Echinococcus granulosus]EUB59344.1 Lethal(2) giant larvae protein [Echinococcus granulosus]